MARPKKENADYFSHDADMRNDARILALRRKFGLNGYAVWCMLLEYLTRCDYFEFDYDDLNAELIAGDFNVDPNELDEIINYLTDKLKLLTSENGKIYCFEHRKRLEPLLSKRKRDRSGVSDSENTQSKVK